MSEPRGKRLKIAIRPTDFLCTDRPTLLAHDLEALVDEYVQNAGFVVQQHFHQTAALLQCDGLQLQLVQRYGQNLKTPMLALQKTYRVAVDKVFVLYKKLALNSKLQLSGEPALAVIGCWEFSMTDSQGNTLTFVQSDSAVFPGIAIAAVPAVGQAG